MWHSDFEGRKRLQKHKGQSHTRITISQKSHGIFRVCSFPSPPTGLTPITHKNLTRTLRLLKINMNIKHNYYSNKYKCYHYLSSPHFGAGRVVVLYWLLDLSRLKVVPSQAPTSGKMRQISASIHKNYPSLGRHGVGLAAPPPKEVWVLYIVIIYGFLPNIIFFQTPFCMWS